MRDANVKLLVVDDEEDVVYSFRRLFEKTGCVVLAANSGREALALASREHPDVVVMDIRMPGDDGIATLRAMRRIEPRTPVILMTAFGSTRSTIEAMKAGAFDYVLKPFEIDKIRRVIQEAAKVSHDMKQVVSYHPLVNEEEHEEEIIGASESMQRVYKLIGRLSNSDLPVLITGESGTGKELVARAIYHHSRRSAKPFLAVNCAALPEHLLESELFGYQKGAFTGADSAKPGKFEICNGGTIFLDEVGEMEISVQGKLLRVLESGEIEKIGSPRPEKVDVRVMAATNRDLARQLEDGTFRADLYYRLRVVEIEMPPLRERMEDLPALVQYFLRRLSHELHLGQITPDNAAMDLLMRYRFPGNVRELENILKNCLVRLPGTVIRPEHLDLGSGDHRVGAGAPTGSIQSPESVYESLFQAIASQQPLPDGMDAFDLVERHLVLRALQHCHGNQSRAARFLGVTRNTLRKRIQKYGLRIEQRVSTDQTET